MTHDLSTVHGPAVMDGDYGSKEETEEAFAAIGRL